MKQLLISLVVVLGLGIMVPAAQAVTIWTEDFSSVSDWSVLTGNGVITSDGSLGRFREPDGADTFFGAFTDSANYSTFDPANKANYDWVFTTDSLMWSVSYAIHLDQFDSSKTYLSTVWNIQPDTTFTGTKTVNLGGFTFDASAAYLSPKVWISTGDPDQSVYYNDMHMDVIPEPASLLLLGTGLLGLVSFSRKKK